MSAEYDVIVMLLGRRTVMVEPTYEGDDAVVESARPRFADWPLEAEPRIENMDVDVEGTGNG